MTGGGSYAVVTPVRDEADNLPRLATALATQELLPERWVIVDTGSTDSTPEIVTRLRAQHDWVDAVDVPTLHGRGGPIVRAFETGLGRVDPQVQVVVKLDADVSFEPDYFRRLVGAFAADPRLGIASGSAWERVRGTWSQRFGTRTSAWGASRAYRRTCLDAISPLEPRIGWDGIDELKANVRGWHTTTILDLPFRHHRQEGMREGTRRAAWLAQGETAHFMGYRPTYLLLRALHRARTEPWALAILEGYVRARARGQNRLDDPEARHYLRTTQRLRHVLRRQRESRGVERLLHEDEDSP